MTQVPPPAANDLTYPMHDRRRKRLLGAGFWAMIAFGLACILAGLGVWHYGPLVFAPDHAAVPRAASPTASLPSDSDQAPEASPVAVSAKTGPNLAASDSALFALRQRVSSLETSQQQQAAAAAAALAAAALDRAAQTSGPFPDDLAAIEPLLPADTNLRALHRLAETGAPTRATLAKTFPAAAARAAAAARGPEQGAGWFANAAHALSAIITVRRIDRTTGNGPDAILARAEAQLDDGDLEGAIKALDALPPQARQAMTDWRRGLDRRAEIDRRIVAVRARALRDLSRAALEGRGQ
jgi:hypothetical protein